jgi:hypothetical protein
MTPTLNLVVWMIPIPCENVLSINSTKAVNSRTEADPITCGVLVRHNNALLK